MANLSSPRSWQVIAITSGAFASFNGLFAKLTTSDTTSALSTFISQQAGWNARVDYVGYVMRIVIFVLSFVFSGIMWALYTKALSTAPSSIQASIVNTSSNFIITALLGQVVFGEKLPVQWWFGAALLLSGSIIIGRREETSKTEQAKKKQ